MRPAGHVTGPGANSFLVTVEEDIFEEDNVSQDWIEELEADVEHTGEDIFYRI